MTLYETPFTDAIALLGAIGEHDRNEYRMNAALHGVELKDDGSVTQGGQSSLRNFHDRVSRRIKGK